MRLGPGERHSITVALSSADCAARRQEKGVLQQLLLLVLATAPHTLTARALAAIGGAAVADVPADWAQPGAGAGGAADGHAAASAAAAPAGSSGGAPGAGPSPFRLFVVARRVTVALLDRPADLELQLSPDSKPYIAGGEAG